MADAPRITVEELKRRMDAGEDFTVIGHSQPDGLGGIGHDAAGSDLSATRQTRRQPSSYPQEQTSRRVLHLNKRGVLDHT
jgi:hypothetical protein